MKNIIFFIMLLGLSGCSWYQSQVKYDDTLVISNQSFPDGWALDFTTEENKWNSYPSFMTYFRKTISALRDLTASLEFFYYQNSEIAHQIYIQYENSVFFGKPGRIWIDFPHEEPNILFANEATFRCTTDFNLMQDNRLICAYWARYERCVIEFNFLALDPYMTLSDFATFIEAEVDQKMPNIEICYQKNN